MEKARTPMRRRVKVHSTPPKAFRRQSTLPLEATEDWGSGIAAEKQSFGGGGSQKRPGPGRRRFIDLCSERMNFKRITQQFHMNQFIFT